MAKLIEIEGSKELEALLKKFPAHVEKTAIQESLSKIAEYIKRLAVAGVRKKTGKLSKKIAVVKRKNYTGVVVKKGGQHWRLIEFGTAPHPIKARRKKVLKIAGEFAGKEVMHPGIAPRPFLRPAARRGIAEGKKMIEDAINKAIADIK